ncbi:sugar phosphate nucleotidyltransferase [Paenibacillus sp. FJAT-26967]|uniref:sugar phosphate nucleotidyltransferase n=1 Tax=Paenibacillus sp. FJAT-26967 TaxID=1729690 RepID=UPI0008397C3C|nr:sugar phosphate nucleotidyltransferase [Paenibacillus sp. FJAT-26967]
MRGVILAGGTGSRLRPLTTIINKHLLPVGKYPMIHYSIKKMKEAGILDVLLVTGKQSAGLYTEYLGSGSQWGMNITYAIQEQAGGIAEALGLAERYIGQGEKFVLLLGDNLFHDSLQPYIADFEKQADGAMVLLKEVSDPRRYGVPVLRDKRIAFIEEKPSNPKSSYCVTGIYFYDSEVFQLVTSCKPSRRGELEITDVNNAYAKAGKLTYRMLKSWWVDAGTHESLYEAAAHIRKEEI